ncbi:DsrE family protein [Sedimentitalea sp. XS_ASV28]|uniref:DsrE family protein n=1 Tax=Sedimentitalea sp. XS_ASV28 TaxID=3241296 RepID=UPI003514A1C4
MATYNIERVIRRVLNARGRVPMCGARMEARGLADGDMLDGAERSTTDELAQAELAADKVLVF